MGVHFVDFIKDKDVKKISNNLKKIMTILKFKAGVAKSGYDKVNENAKRFIDLVGILNDIVHEGKKVKKVTERANMPVFGWTTR
jgi:hypothetical protein